MLEYHFNTVLLSGSAVYCSGTTDCIESLYSTFPQCTVLLYNCGALHYAVPTTVSVVHTAQHHSTTSLQTVLTCTAPGSSKKTGTLPFFHFQPHG